MSGWVDVDGIGDAVMLDARVGKDVDEAFAAGHLQGALQAHLERDLSGDTSHPQDGGRHPLPSLEDWAATLGRWGIGPTTRVVCYDDRGGVMGAARAWWMLRAVGHTEVYVLRGGFQAAVAAGLAVETGDERPAPRGAYPVGGWSLPTVARSEVAAHLARGGTVVDVRAAERFAGHHEPIDPVAGHIDGARNVPLTTHQADGAMLSAEALRAQFADWGAPDDVVVHCGSGVTACYTLLAMHEAGRDGAALYVGSWSEWCRNV